MSIVQTITLDAEQVRQALLLHARRIAIGSGKLGIVPEDDFVLLAHGEVHLTSEVTPNVAVLFDGALVTVRG